MIYVEHFDQRHIVSSWGYVHSKCYDEHLHKLCYINSIGDADDCFGLAETMSFQVSLSENDEYYSELYDIILGHGGWSLIDVKE